MVFKVKEIQIERASLLNMFYTRTPDHTLTRAPDHTLDQHIGFQSGFQVLLVLPRIMFGSNSVCCTIFGKKLSNFFKGL